MNDNNQGTCWALVHIPRDAQTLATANRSQASDSRNVGSEGSAAPGPRRRGKEKLKRYPVQFEVNGKTVDCWVEIYGGKNVVFRVKHGQPFHMCSLQAVALREYRITKGQLCL